MNKTELAMAIAKEHNLPFKRAQAVNIIIGTISNALADGQRVELRDFGSFAVKEYT